jgi:hypothetical protein
MKSNSRSLRTAIAVLAACVALVLSGCGGSAGGGGGADSGGGTGSITGDGGLLMVFMPSTSNVYLKAAAEAIKTESDELGYEVKIVENDWDQTEQDQQVQEWLATGEEAEAVLFWPASAAAATNSIRQLSAKAPVIQWNQLVQEDAQEFVTAYAGVSDLAMGRQAGVDALGALDELTASGRQWRGPGGKPNLIEIRFTAGYAVRSASATPDGFTNMLLLGVSAALVGGIALSGGRGGMVNVLLGVIITSTLAAGLSSMGVKAYVSELLTGVLLLAVIGLDAALAWGARRRRLAQHRSVLSALAVEPAPTPPAVVHGST